MPTFFGDPSLNSRLLLSDIDAIFVGPRDSNMESVTRLVNRGTLELYRAWKWHEARELCVDYLGRLRFSARSDRFDVGSLLINLCRLDAAVGDWEGCMSWLSELSEQKDAHATICREATNAAILCRRIDTSEYLSSWGISVDEIDLVARHTEFIASGDIGWGHEFEVPQSSREMWSLEIGILAAGSRGTPSDVSSMAQLALSAARDGAGTSPVAALDRCADLLLLHGHTDSARVVGEAIRGGAAALDALGLEIRGTARICESGTEPHSLSGQLEIAERASMPREASRLWRAVLRLHISPSCQEVTRASLAHLELDPAPVEEATVGDERSLSGTLGAWDGLGDSTRESLALLGDRLLYLIRAVE